MATENTGGTEYHGTAIEKRVKPLRWTSHALEMLLDRAMDLSEVEQTIAAPELSVIDPPRRVVLMRRYFDRPLGAADA
ncbi:hypothetical protein Q8G50_31120, partial [Klebsiella pneumoniae]